MIITNLTNSMEKHYTDYTLIKYLYQDVGICEQLETEYAIKNDAKVKKRFNAFKFMTSILSDVTFSPSALNIQKLNLYSQIQNVQAN